MYVITRRGAIKEKRREEKKKQKKGKENTLW